MKNSVKNNNKTAVATENCYGSFLNKLFAKRHIFRLFIYKQTRGFFTAPKLYKKIRTHRKMSAEIGGLTEWVGQSHNQK